MIKLYNDDALKILDELVKKNVKFDAIIADIPSGETQANWDKILPWDDVFDKLEKLKKDEATPIILYGGGMTGAMLRLRKDFKYKWYVNNILTTNNNNARHQPLRCIEEWMVFYTKKGKYNPQFRIGKPNHNSPNDKSIGKTIGQGVYGKSKVVYSNLQEHYNLDPLPKGQAYKHPVHYIEFRKPHPSKAIVQSEKSTELMEFFIKTYTNEGDLLLDFTMGGGSTIVSAINTNRNAIGIENDHERFNIARKRTDEEPKGGGTHA